MHPVLACLAAASEAITAVADVEVAYLSAGEKQAALLQAGTLITLAEELRLRVLAAGDALGDVAEGDGSRDAAAWLAAHARLDPAESRRLARLADALGRYPVLASAVRAGKVDVAQAEVVAAALDALPDHVVTDVKVQAEERLVAEAGTFAPRRLRQLGRRILDVVAADVAEAEEARQLAAEDNQAKAKTFLRFRRRGDGTTDLHGRLSDDVASRLQRYLAAWTNPRRTTPDQTTDQDGGLGFEARSARTSTSGSKQPGAGDKRPYDQKTGEAFGALLEAADPSRPGGGCVPATSCVVSTHRSRARSSPARFARPSRLVAASQARPRALAPAGTLPAVLDGDSHVLDLGRTRRLFNPAQRKALAIRHPRCAAHGCDIPAPWREAHHAGEPWSKGGRTDLTDGVLLCSHHHHLAHDPRYDTTRHPDGTVRFHKRV